MQKELFEINPSWNIKYIDYIDKFIQEKKLYFRADRIKAKNIFEQQRKFKLNAILILMAIIYIYQEYFLFQMNMEKLKLMRKG